MNSSRKLVGKEILACGCLQYVYKVIGPITDEDKCEILHCHMHRTGDTGVYLPSQQAKPSSGKVRKIPIKTRTFKLMHMDWKLLAILSVSFSLIISIGFMIISLNILNAVIRHYPINKMPVTTSERVMALFRNPYLPQEPVQQAETSEYSSPVFTTTSRNKYPWLP